jgi:hypothetical protein
MDPLSDRRFVVNYFRLYLDAGALSLPVPRRRFSAEPLPALPTRSQTAAPTGRRYEAALAADDRTATPRCASDAGASACGSKLGDRGAPRRLR